MPSEEQHNPKLVTRESWFWCCSIFSELLVFRIKNKTIRNNPWQSHTDKNDSILTLSFTCTARFHNFSCTKIYILPDGDMHMKRKSIIFSLRYISKLVNQNIKEASWMLIHIHGLWGNQEKTTNSMGLQMDEPARICLFSRKADAI